MKMIPRLYRFIKHNIHMYLVFRKLTRTQIDALHRQAALVKDTKRKHSPKSPPRFELTASGPHGLAVLREVAR